MTNLQFAFIDTIAFISTVFTCFYLTEVAVILYKADPSNKETDEYKELIKDGNLKLFLFFIALSICTFSRTYRKLESLEREKLVKIERK